MLVDSEGLANGVFSRLLTECGLEMSADECIERFMGGSIGRVRRDWVSRPRAGRRMRVVGYAAMTPAGALADATTVISSMDELPDVLAAL